MKLVREHIIEKFIEKSDPISDMSIGMKHLIKKWVITETEYDYNEKDLLWICAKYGKLEFVKYLLDVGADVHASDDTALRWASEEGHTDVVKLLLDAGADVHAGDDGALWRASKNGHTDVVKFLLDAGADVHASDDTALRWASNRGHTKIVKILKDHIAKEKRKKKIKESLNEKFIQDSDPIQDMNIGMMKFYEDALHEDAYMSSVQGSMKYFGDKKHQEELYTIYLILKFIVTRNIRSSENIIKAAKKIIKLRLHKHREITLLKRALKDHLYIDLYKNVNEKFVADSDPISDMGIGLRGVYDNLKPGDVFRLKKSLGRFSKTVFEKGNFLRITYIKKYPFNEYNVRVDTQIIDKNGTAIYNNPNYYNWGWSYDFFKEYFEPVNLENLKQVKKKRGE